MRGDDRRLGRRHRRIRSHKSPWERPELSKWFDRPEQWDALIFWRLDRFVRKVSDFTEMIKWCQAHDKNLISATETIDIRSPIGRVIAYLVSAFAEMEAEAIRERVTGSHDHLRRNGRWAVVSLHTATGPSPSLEARGCDS
ncbi:recombinase family protein [Streptomyces sp. NPDC048483]|uniref:recombinase family protein n=1 Tax=Streptomyces sp. NPDC048483 TaxID=3154927 RepID=UPI00341225BA